ncbi:hypothetical protein QQS21_010014 [Conoideocrella luteorostrata]|uniref:Uncharacterized protein n=1 Tax=Conoideocrella luteorostrata TaxID=1105319 RepID=A0AAJ0CIK5_9HYPO|nr:hypothetical protein QQS21_010014 [Conoideocrella luteorostrata]
MLETANLGTVMSESDPVVRFRISSHMLTRAPLFARTFSGHSTSVQSRKADITARLPTTPTPYICEDGTEVKLYRMPQHEVNRLRSLEILMHAAHMHNDMVPEEVRFEQFAAIAECPIRYKSTSALKRIAEHKWLSQWTHYDMPDGLLVISYVFDYGTLKIDAQPCITHASRQVCDLSSDFRTAIADIYNSVTGLDFIDIDKKNHVATDFIGIAASDVISMEGTTFPDSIRFQILGEIDSISDLYAAAQINRVFTKRIELMK